MPLETGWLQALAIILASLLAVYFMIKQAREVEEMQKRLAAPVRRYTIIQCPSGEKKERPYRQGDYVGKQDQCPNTDETGRIIGIYAEKEEPEKKRRPKKRQEHPESIPTI